jgi:hypothetical protein
MSKTQRGRFFTGPNNLVFYLTRPGHFYALEPSGPRALTDAEADDQVLEEILTEQPHELHALAVAAERHAMVREPHRDVR